VQDVWLVTVGSVAADVLRGNRRNHPQEKKLGNRHKLSMRAVKILSGYLGGGPRLEDITLVVPWV
jgi:hypothetical protein